MSPTEGEAQKNEMRLFDATCKTVGASQNFGYSSRLHDQ